MDLYTTQTKSLGVKDPLVPDASVYLKSHGRAGKAAILLASVTAKANGVSCVSSREPIADSLALWLECGSSSREAAPFPRNQPNRPRPAILKTAQGFSREVLFCGTACGCIAVQCTVLRMEARLPLFSEPTDLASLPPLSKCCQIQISTFISTIGTMDATTTLV
jgi:hypothetical protein